MPDYSNHEDVMELLNTAQGSDSDLRDEVRESHLFVNKKDGQWEPYWWNLNTGKPRYSFDMTGPVVDQIAGEMEQADFDIRVSPASGDASKEDAKTLDGMIRNIENLSNASHIFNSAGRSMVTGGVDGWRVVQKYIDDDSFDQDLVIEKISNFVDRVWFDEASEMQDRSDARWCVVMQGLLKDDYEKKWPEGSAMGVSDDRPANAYFNKPDMIMVGEILYKKPFDRELVLMTNGDVLEANDDYDKIVDELAAIGVTEKSRRTRKGHKVYSRFFDANDWLDDEKETVFSFIPVIPTYGNFCIFENKTTYHGAVRSLMDYQRVLNYSESRAIAEVALAPRAKIPMTQAMIEGNEDELATLNTDDSPVLPFNVDPNLPGYIPQQIGGAQVNQGLAVISANMKDGIARAAGLFAANMGEQVNNQSGVAIKALQDKGNIGTIKYFASQEIAICHTARILVNAIPKVYDTERQVRILGEDGAVSIATLNEMIIDEETGETVRKNDLSKGKYDVVCSAGPSFQNKQQETVAGIMEMAQLDPSIIPENGDILFNNISAPGMDLIAERKRLQLFDAGLIPEEQMTDDELEELDQIEQEQAQQQQQPDALMVAAQAAAQEAQAETEKNQIAFQKDQMDAQIKMAQQQLSQQKAEIDFQEKQAKFALQTQEFELKSQQSEFDNAMKLQQQQRDSLTQVLSNANLEADTLKKIREAMGIDSIVGPSNMEAYINQAENVEEATEQ